jgi:hypothetical protein
MGTSEAKVQVGRIWGRGIEWDAIRTLLASDARTEMGRDRALTASPLTDATEVQAALDLTAEARHAITQEGAPPLDGVPDVRPALERAGAEGAALDGPELLLFVPAMAVRSVRSRRRSAPARRRCHGSPTSATVCVSPSMTTAP